MKLEQRADNRNTAPPPSSGSQSVARALSVLDLLSEVSEGLGVREMARRLNLAPSIVQRLVGTLASSGYIERSATAQKYGIGYRAFHVGHSYLSHNDLHEVSLPELRMLAEQYEVNTFLGVLRDRAIVYLATIQSSGPIVIRNSPGSRTWLHSTALGKALLAEMTDQDVAEILGDQPYHRLTSKTKTTHARLKADLHDIRRQGFAVSDEENLEAVFSVGAVIRDASGHAVAALSCAVPRGRLHRSDRENLYRAVMDATQRISRRLGARAPAQPGRMGKTKPRRS